MEQELGARRPAERPWENTHPLCLAAPLEGESPLASLPCQGEQSAPGLGQAATGTAAVPSGIEVVFLSVETGVPPSWHIRIPWEF